MADIDLVRTDRADVYQAGALAAHLTRTDASAAPYRRTSPACCPKGAG